MNSNSKYLSAAKFYISNQAFYSSTGRSISNSSLLSRKIIDTFCSSARKYFDQDKNSSIYVIFENRSLVETFDFDANLNTNQIGIIKSCDLGTPFPFTIFVIPSQLSDKLSPKLVGGGSIDSIDNNDFKINKKKLNEFNFTGSQPILQLALITKLLGGKSLTSKQESKANGYLNYAATSPQDKKGTQKLKYFVKKYTNQTEAAQENYLVKKAQNLKSQIAKKFHRKNEEIFFTPQGASYAINLVAQNLANKIDESWTVITSKIEHHSNLAPWINLAEKTGAKLQILEFDKNHKKIKLPEATNLASKKIIVAISGYSNVLGSLWKHDFSDLQAWIKEVSRYCDEKIIFLDASQAILVTQINLQNLDVDYLCFSAHKICGVTNLGILFAKKERSCNLIFLSEKSSLPLLEILQLDACWKKLAKIKLEKNRKKLNKLYKNAEQITSSYNFETVSNYDKKTANKILTVETGHYHPHDIADLLAERNVVIRSGDICAMLVGKSFGISSFLRISFSWQSSIIDVNKFGRELKKVVAFLNTWQAKNEL